MLKAENGQALIGGVSRGSVLSSLARHGSILAWLGLVRSSPVKLSKALYGFILVLRGLAWGRTVLSCPVRHCKERLGKVLSWYGGAGSGPAGSSGALFCKVRRFLVRSGCAGRSTVERGFVLCGTVLLLRGVVRFACVGLCGLLFAKLSCCMAWFCEALSCVVKQSPVKSAEALSWLGDVLFGLVGLSGVLQGLASLGRGVVWSDEVLHGVVEFGPVKHSVARFAFITEGSGFARLSAAGQAMLSLRRGQVWLGTVLSSNVWCSLVSLRLGVARLGRVMRGPAMQGNLRYGGYQK